LSERASATPLRREMHGTLTEAGADEVESGAGGARVAPGPMTIIGM